MQTSDRGLALIRKWEGFRARPYVCPGGVLTVGYGHTDPRHVRAGMAPIDAAQAAAWLAEDVREAEQAVANLVGVPLTQGQLDGIVDFTFNLGRGALAGSTLLRKLNARRYGEIDAELRRWVYAGGRRLAGLEDRREDECLLFDDRAPDVDAVPPTDRETDMASRGGVAAADDAVALEAPPATRSVLRPGAAGAAVDGLQQLLHEAGVLGYQPGTFDPATEVAVRLFQQTRGLAVDGVVGRQTWAALLTTTGVDR